MFRDVPYIVAGENETFGSTVSTLSTDKESTATARSRFIDRWNMKEVYHGVIPYCVGNMAFDATAVKTMSLKVGIEHGDKADGSDMEELIQHADLTPHTTIFPDTGSTDKRYFQTNATHWDLRRAKRYIRSYVVPTFDGVAADRFHFHVGLALFEGDDQPPTNPTVA